MGVSDEQFTGGLRVMYVLNPYWRQPLVTPTPKMIRVGPIVATKMRP